MQKLAQKHTKKINLNLELFEQSIKSEYTRKVYIVCLEKYFQFPHSSKFVECDHTTDPRNVEKHIIDYIISLKKEEKNKIFIILQLIVSKPPMSYLLES